MKVFCVLALLFVCSIEARTLIGGYFEDLNVYAGQQPGVNAKIGVVVNRGCGATYAIECSEQKLGVKYGVNRNYMQFTSNPTNILNNDATNGRLSIMSWNFRGTACSTCKWADMAAASPTATGNPLLLYNQVVQLAKYYKAFETSSIATSSAWQGETWLTFWHEPENDQPGRATTASKVMGTSTDWIGAWTAFVKIFNAQGVTKVKHGIIYMPWPDTDMYKFWPDTNTFMNSMVSWVGFDPYVWYSGVADGECGPMRLPKPFGYIVDTSLKIKKFVDYKRTTGKMPNLQIAVTEVGAREGNKTDKNSYFKNQWITDMFTYLKTSWTDLYALCYFDAYGGCNHWIDTSQASWDAWAGLKTATWLGKGGGAKCTDCGLITSSTTAPTSAPAPTTTTTTTTTTTKPPTTVKPVACTTLAVSNNAYQPSPLTAAQKGTFTFSFKLTSALGATDQAYFGLSNGAQTAGATYGPLARFYLGNVHAYNGGTGYTSVATVAYTKNIEYTVTFVVNTAANTYTLTVTPAGGKAVTVATNYKFKTASTQLTHYGIVDFTANSNAKFCGFALSTGTTPSTAMDAPNGDTVAYVFTVSVGGEVPARATFPVDSFCEALAQDAMIDMDHITCEHPKHSDPPRIKVTFVMDESVNVNLTSVLAIATSSNSATMMMMTNSFYSIASVNNVAVVDNSTSSSSSSSMDMSSTDENSVDMPTDGPTVGPTSSAMPTTDMPATSDVPTTHMSGTDAAVTTPAPTMMPTTTPTPTSQIANQVSSSTKVAAGLMVVVAAICACL